MNTVDEFYELAKEYCRYVNENEISKKSIDYLMSIIMKLYVSALQLRELEVDIIDHENSGVRLLESLPIKISKEIPTSYWEVYYPFYEEEVVCGSLYDDLSSIFIDLQRGITEYEAERFGNAVFEWVFGLENDWGYHAVDLLKALHTLRLD